MDVKRSYFEDVRLFDSWPQVIWSVVLLSFLVGFPFVAGSYYTYVLGYTAIHVIVALGPTSWWATPARSPWAMPDSSASGPTPPSF